jgi:hypothetical protein
MRTTGELQVLIRDKREELKALKAIGSPYAVDCLRQLKKLQEELRYAGGAMVEPWNG